MTASEDRAKKAQEKTKVKEIQTKKANELMQKGYNYAYIGQQLGLSINSVRQILASPTEDIVRCRFCGTKFDFNKGRNCPSCGQRR